MSVEKSLKNYLKGIGPKVKPQDFCDSSFSNINDLVNALFKLVNDELDAMDGATV